MILELTKELLSGFKGIKYIPDVHGNIKEFDLAIEDAIANNLFILQGGDLVDRGPAPSACVERMREVEEALRGKFLNGNHEEKFDLFVRKGKFNSLDRRITFEDFYRCNRLDTMDWYVDRIQNGYFWARSPKCVIAHGGYHPDMLETETKDFDDARRRALRGIEIGKDHWGLPVRSHRWVDEIPDGITVLVGHDIVSYKEPVVKWGKKGGNAVFCDNGADSGHKLGCVTLTFEDLGI